MHESSPQPRSFISNPRSALIDRNDHTVQPDRLASVIESRAFKSLLNLGCSREILSHAVHRFAMACSQPTTARKAFKLSKIDEKQISRRIAEAEDLLGFIRLLQQNPLLVVANEMPPSLLFLWRKDLEDIANWLKRIKPWQPDPMIAALIIVLHIKETTGKQRLATGAKVATLDVLIAARDKAGATTPALTSDSFDRALKRTSRADRKRAEDILASWKLLSSFH